MGDDRESSARYLSPHPYQNLVIHWRHWAISTTTVPFHGPIQPVMAKAYDTYKLEGSHTPGPGAYETGRSIGPQPLSACTNQSCFTFSKAPRVQSARTTRPASSTVPAHALSPDDGLLELPSVGKQLVSTRRTQPSFSFGTSTRAATRKMRAEDKELTSYFMRQDPLHVTHGQFGVDQSKPYSFGVASPVSSREVSSPKPVFGRAARTWIPKSNFETKNADFLPVSPTSPRNASPSFGFGTSSRLHKLTMSLRK